MSAYFFRARSSTVPKHKNSVVSLMEMGPNGNGDGLQSPQYGGHDLPVHPRLWLLLGLMYLALGVTQMVLAATWRWWFGVAVGLGICKTGSSLTGLGYTGGRQVSGATTLLGRLRRLPLRVLLWGSAKIQQLLWRLRWLIYANGIFVALLISIHLGSPDPHPALGAFPAACPSDKRFGCSRVAELEAHGARGLQPAYLESSIEFIQRAAEDWVGVQGQPAHPARLLVSGPGFVHARFVTFLFGFADDFFVSIRCANGTHAVVEVQGQLRLGTSDLGVNRRRNKRFLAAIEAAAASGEIPEGRCRDDDRTEEHHHHHQQQQQENQQQQQREQQHQQGRRL